MVREVCLATAAAESEVGELERSESTYALSNSDLQTYEPTLQLLCVSSPRQEAGAASDSAWTEALKRSTEVTNLASLDDLVEYVINRHADAVVMHLSELDADVLDAISTVRAYREESVIVAVTPDPEGELAIAAIRHGADDCLDTDFGSFQNVTRHLRQGLARRHRSSGADNQLDEGIAGMPRFEQRQSHFQQRSPRYYVTKSAIAIPIRPDLTPDQSMRAEGFTVQRQRIGYWIRNWRLGRIA